MIRIDITPRFLRSIGKLGPQAMRLAEEKLGQCAENFGNPHHHGGLGIRKLGRKSYEVRLTLGWRIVLIKEADRLTAYDVMDHEGVRRWLKNRGGE